MAVQTKESILALLKEAGVAFEAFDHAEAGSPEELVRPHWRQERGAAA